jgi:hypothetical protein
MPVAVGLLVLGLTLVYSAVKGISITDVFQGETGNPLNPKGGTIGALAKSITGTTDNSLIQLAAGPADLTTGGVGQFKGPNAAKLEALRKVATSRYHLHVTQICRPQNATYGAPNSLHKQCRAFDSTGSVSDRIAFARYAKSQGADEVFCDQAGMVAPGYDHSDHVHVGW